MEYGVQMASCDMIYVPSFIEIGRGVQAILTFCLGNFRGFNCAVEMVSGAMIYIPSFIKISSSFYKLIGGYIYRQTDTQTNTHSKVIS
jgi:hypothetical protein